MLRHILAAGVAILAVLLFSMGPANADRLGGAYRGPYNDRQTPKDEVNPEVTSQQSTGDTGPSGPESSGGGGGAATSGGETGGSTGGGGEATGGGSESGGGTTGGGEPPPESGGGSEAGTTTGGGSGTTAPPTGPSGTGSSGSGTIGGGQTTGPGGGKKAVEDVLAYWPFWFEHNKEWILSGVLRERSAASKMPERSSSALLVSGGAAENVRTPVTEDQLKVIQDVLLEALTNESEWVRDSAVLALGKLGTPEVVGYLKARLSDPQPDVREDALLALGLTGRKEALLPLMEALQGSDLNTKAFASLGLALLGIRDVKTVLLTEFNSLVRNPKAEQAAACIAVALGMLGDESVVDALGQPLVTSRSKHLKVYICQALSRIGGDSARTWLTRAFADRDAAVKAAGALGLGNFPDPAVVGKLLKNGLKDGDRSTSLFSVVSLGRIGKSLLPDDGLRRKMVKDLKEVAEKPQADKYKAMYATLALAIMGDDAANDFFVDYLSRENRTKYSQETHSAMAMAMGLLEYRPAIRDLREIVSRGRVEDDYRGYAAFALGIMGDQKSKPTILKTIEDDKNRSDLMRSCAWALGLLGDSTDVPVLIDLLKMKGGGGKHQVRGAAAIAIGLIGDSSAVKPLVKMAKDDADSSNRAFAIAALGCLIDKDPVPRIPQLFQNIHYRQELDVVTQVLANL